MKRAYSIFTLILALNIGLSACSKKKTKTLGSTESTQNTNNNTPAEGRAPTTDPSNFPAPAGGGSYAAYNKVCFIDLKGFTVKHDEPKLEALFGGWDRQFGTPGQAGFNDYLVNPIVNLEEVPELCLRLYGTGKDKGAAVRFEYEDNSGGGELNFLYASSIYSEVTSSKIHLIWMDGEGILELKGNKLSNGKYKTTIRFANFDPDYEYINSSSNNYSFWDSEYQKCSNGTLNFSQCFNSINVVIFDDAWYDPATYSFTQDQVRDLAVEFLNGGYGAETKTLGNIEFNLSDVMAPGY